MILRNGEILTGNFTFEKLDLELDETISDIFMKDDRAVPAIDDVLDLSGCYVLPGFFDVHTHGAVGLDSMDYDDFSTWRDYMYKNGIMNFFPTTVSETKENILETLTKLAQEEDVIGINLEGPYLEAGHKGAHEEATIRPADLEEMRLFQKTSGNKIKLTTIAPDIEGNVDFIRQITKEGVRVALGHTNATYEEAMDGFAAGATECTHLFNAMTPLVHRAPGMAGAAMDCKNAFCEVISDGIHLDPAVVRIAYAVLGSERMVLISDSMAATGLADGEYQLGGLKIIVKDGVARTEYGAIAGSTKNIRQMVQKAISFGIPLTEAIKMATLTPARAMGMEDKLGSIEIGKQADLVITDKNLEVLYAIKKGQVVYQK
ncbi:MAG: N-acetylglucosamine-6-phosphate deacetylase [Clostridia bacterium]|nr:N-acetylglucosamine-6-phosphate deacetylase [Clostridia bacterium]